MELRRAVASDAKALTDLYHDAYSVWKEKGLRFGPMHQTQDKTAEQLSGLVYVMEEGGQLLGSVAVDLEGAILLENLDNPHTVPAGKLLRVKKGAVARSRAHAGIGKTLVAHCEKLARAEHCIGMILETAPEADWVVAWCRRMGFVDLGAYRYPDMKTDTLLMVRLFDAK
jgi:GNAT superfamily N-acetyltransferase